MKIQNVNEGKEIRTLDDLKILEELVIGRMEPYFRVRFEIDAKKYQYLDIKGNGDGSFDISVDDQIVVQPMASNRIKVSEKDE